MKRIVAMCSLDTFPYLLLGCFGTLSKYSRKGSKTHLLITLDPHYEKMDHEKSRMGSIQRAAKCTNVSEISFVEGFNYDSVSQNNVNLLRSFIESINPSLVFIPFRRATNSRHGVLGSSAFLACRWVTNILLYEVGKNPNFIPTVFSNLSDHDHAAKLKSIQEFNDNNAHWHLNKSDDAQQVLYDIANIVEFNAKYLEAFESHRLVLLSSNDVV
jgi:LmbE family N-acetylglucosaminyl deacetylase